MLSFVVMLQSYDYFSFGMFLFKITDRFSHVA